MSNERYKIEALPNDAFREGGYLYVYEARKVWWWLWRWSYLAGPFTSLLPAQEFIKKHARENPIRRHLSYYDEDGVEDTHGI